MPSNAYGVRYSMSANRDAGADLHGPKAHTAVRTSWGVLFTASTGDWAALDVHGVHVGYWTKHRI